MFVHITVRLFCDERKVPYDEWALVLRATIAIDNEEKKKKKKERKYKDSTERDGVDMP